MNAKNIFSQIGINYLIYGLFIILVSIIISNIIGLIPAIQLNPNEATLLNSIITYILPLPLMFYLMNKIEKTEIKKKSLNVKKLICLAIIAIAIMIIGNIIGNIVTTIISSIITQPIVNPVNNLISTPAVWANIILVIVFAPIFEEIFFRKLLIDRTIKYGELVSILLSAVLFGLFHGNLNQFFYTFILGGFFAIIYIRTGNILYTIGLHFWVNFFGCIVPMFTLEHLNNFIGGSLNIIDTIIASSYLIFILIAIFTSIVLFIKYYKNLNIDKGELENPIKTAIINPGIIIFICFEIVQIILNTV